MQRLLPAVGSVDYGSLVKLLIHTGQGRYIYDGIIAQALPYIASHKYGPKKLGLGNQACRLILGNHGPQLGNRTVLGTELVYQGADHYHGYEVRHIADGLNTFLKKFPSHLIQKQSENNGKRKSNQQIQKADQKSVF